MRPLSPRGGPRGLLLAPGGFGTLALAVLARIALTLAENSAMIAGSRAEARTDALTGLGNRRKLLDDLEAALQHPGEESVLGPFDPNGFKLYNDSFGHPSGDVLLARLGQSLERHVAGRGHAYRMGRKAPAARRHPVRSGGRRGVRRVIGKQQARLLALAS